LVRGEQTWYKAQQADALGMKNRLSSIRISVILERIADGGEKDLDMREKALHQEKQLAIQKRIDILKDKIDDLEVKLDEEEKEVYRRILNRKKAELEELESQLE
jgi:hypothetical protein